jgi:hypothetical protein
VRLGQKGLARRKHGNPEPITGLLHNHFRAPEFQGRYCRQTCRYSFVPVTQSSSRHRNSTGEFLIADRPISSTLRLRSRKSLVIADRRHSSDWSAADSADVIDIDVVGSS